MSGKMTKAVHYKPSGFSDVGAFKSEVTILGFVWGTSQDVGRYSDRRDECVLAVIADEAERLSAVPIANLALTQEDSNAQS